MKPISFFGFAFVLCSGNCCSSALGEKAAQIDAFFKEFAGFVITHCMLFGSDICENCIEDDT